MPPSIAAAVRALEASTRRLVDAEAEDFSTISGALERRHQALSELRQAKAADLLAVSGISDRLRAALEGGAETCRRLRVLRAAALADLTRTQREGFVLSTLSSPAPKSRICLVG